ncbi:MAG: hypothetical protein R3D98_04395 [Candidatus Krumholzibacteriia bacterium]
MPRRARRFAGRHLAGAAALVLAALALAGCGSTSSWRPGDMSAAPSGLYVDWDYQDWCIDRFILVAVRDSRQAREVDRVALQREYLDAVTFQAAWDSLSLVTFLGLDPAEQQARRRDGASALRDARRAILSTVNYYRGVGDRAPGTNLTSVNVPMPPAGTETAVSVAIAKLVAATGIDPANAAAWHDLGYFCGIVGDRVRQQRALASCLAALDQASADVVEHVDALRLRRDVLLDLAWLARDLGQPAVTVAYLDHLQPWLDVPGREREERQYEAQLLRGLALADQGEWLAAVSQARDLPRLRVTTRTLAGGAARQDLRWSLTAPHFMTLGFDRAAWPQQPSDFGRRWIKALAGAPAGESSHILWLLGPPPTHLEFPARLASRYWQDQGKIYAAAGEREMAGHCYEWASLYRPFAMFFPLTAADGNPRGGQPAYFVGYGTYFLCGDREAYDRDADAIVAERSRTSLSPD